MWRRPWRRGGPARTSGSRWRPKPIRLRFSFGLQEQAALKRTPRLHTESDLGALDMDGKIISRRFQWLWFQAQIHPESTGIVCGSWCPESVPVLRHCFWADGPCIVLEPNRGASRGSCMTKTLISSRCYHRETWVLLRFILSRTVVAVHRFVKLQLVRLVIHLQSHFN